VDAFEEQHLKRTQSCEPDKSGSSKLKRTQFGLATWD